MNPAAVAAHLAPAAGAGAAVVLVILVVSRRCHRHPQQPSERVENGASGWLWLILVALGQYDGVLPSASPRKAQQRLARWA